MKKILFLISIILLNSGLLFSQIAINNDGSPPDPSAGLDVSFTNKGFLLPRMTYEQRNAIPTPAEGLMVYCTNCASDGAGALSIFQGGIWKNFNLDCATPNMPDPGVHTPSLEQIIWEWDEVPLAVGYKWNTVNDFSTATDVGTATAFTETGLTCWTTYTRYVWAYNECGPSPAQALTGSTLQIPFSPAPVPFMQFAEAYAIDWSWFTVDGATGYKWNTTDDPNTAIDLGVNTYYEETGLNCLTSYTRYVWAYDACGISQSTALTATTTSSPPGSPGAGTHIAGVYQIEWNWNTVPGATGYKWNTINSSSGAQDMGTTTTKLETGLACNFEHTSFVWAYSDCGESTSTQLVQSTGTDPPAAPVAATPTPGPYQITWNWNAVSGADGYKWNTTNDYNTATNVGTAIFYNEPGLDCNTSYTRFVWAYSDCGVSGATTLSGSTTLDPPDAPVAGTHVPLGGQITWNWNVVVDATGYLYSTENDTATATDLGNLTTYVQTGLSCNTPYTLYVWAYSDCGVSTSTALNSSTILDPPTPPVAGTHVATASQITWNWNAVSGADGYKWSAVNNFEGADDLGTNLAKIETGLACNTSFTRYVWAYTLNCGHSEARTLTKSTSNDPPSAPVAGTHIPTPDQITWNWNAVTGATGYKRNTVNNYSTATDLGNVTTFIQTGLNCNTAYTLYLWAYNTCTNSSVTTLTQTTSLSPPASPAEGTHVSLLEQITWNWNIVTGATGYKWGTTNVYGSAIDKFANTSHIETSLACNDSFTRYIWAYSNCGVSGPTTITGSTLTQNPPAPTAATHTATGSAITWNWNTSTGATGYKWGTSNNYASAIDKGTSTTHTEPGLSCDTPYERYVWAYGDCGVSGSTLLSQSTADDSPLAPVAATHDTYGTEIVWNWNAVSGATGYLWGETNVVGNAIEIGLITSYTESGLTCSTPYTRYVWASNGCGNSPVTGLSASTNNDSPAAPTAATHAPLLTQITWNWNAVPGAEGYKWNTINNFNSAIDLETSTTWIETGLTCGNNYTRFVWAYNACGESSTGTMSQSTQSCWTCTQPMIITHVAGDIAPVNKTTTYGTVNNVPGETSKCWITSNLGSDHQATVVNDVTEPSAGWYWQFNLKQGYKHDGATRTPDTEWIANISEYTNWTSDNDPCASELGAGWRIPTSTEWTNVDAVGGWGTWNGPWGSLLKLHAAGRLYASDGTLGTSRGINGVYWSSTQSTASVSLRLNFNSGICSMSTISKTYGYSIRCIR